MISYVTWSQRRDLFQSEITDIERSCFHYQEYEDKHRIACHVASFTIEIYFSLGDSSLITES